MNFSDSLATESRMLDQLMERHEENEAQQSSDSYADLFVCVQTLMNYDEYKYDLIHDQVFVRSRKTFDSWVWPTSTQDILAALRMHPSSGEYGMVLFISDYQKQEGREKKIQEAMRVSVDHLQIISEYIITPHIETTTTKNYNTSTTNEELINLRNLDIGSIHNRICDIALAIKSGGTTLSQKYFTLKTLIESAVIILLEQGLHMMKYLPLYRSRLLSSSEYLVELPTTSSK